MDEDSQDELVSRSAGARARSRVPVVSEADDSSDVGPSCDSEEDSGSEEEEEDEDAEEGSDWDSAEDSASGDEDAPPESPKARPDSSAGGAPSSDEDAESCPICLNAFRGQAVGTPENCAHYFCLDCIVEWSKNANSCPVDRILFKWICIRAQFGGKVLKKVPVESQKAPQAEEEEDPTFCEVCGRSDREDRLLLCDGCDAGYHMECLNPSLSEVPIDEWFCPECVATAAPAAPPAAATDAEPVSEEEVALLLVDVVPTTSRLRPTAGRTRAIARTRQSERVRATVNRNRISTARRIQRVPRYLMSSLLDETIEAVASGLSTAVYRRPLAPRAPVRRKRKAGRRKKASGRKRAASKLSARSKASGTRPKRRKSRVKKRKGQRKRVKTDITARSRLARTLGLGKPLRGASIPSVYKPVEPSLGFMRADIGAASLSLFGDPYELDPYDSGEELPANRASPLSTKRRILSQSALRSHQPVARPVPVGLSSEAKLDEPNPGVAPQVRRSVPASVPEQDVEVAPVPDLLGSILSGQNLLMMSGSDVVINRDGSLTARKAAPISLQRSSAAKNREDGETRSRAGVQPRTLQSGTSVARLSSDVSEHLGSNSSGGPTANMLSPSSSSCLRGSEKSVTPSLSEPRRATVKLEYSMTPRPVQTQNLANRNRLGLKPNGTPPLHGDNKRPVAVTSESPKALSRTAIGQPLPATPRRIDISELPRIPKMRREGHTGSDGHVDAMPTGAHGADIPSSCINRLTGREGSGQPARGGHGESKPGSRDSQEPKTHSGSGGGGGSCASASGPGSHSSLAAFGSSRGKGLGSSFESFRINIPGNTAHASRLPNPGFCNTFRPVDNKVQRKENPSPLFSIKKTKQIKSEIYDPFDPTGSDSSSPSSSPERLGAGLLPSEITRTISVDSPKVPTFQTVRCVTSYTVENIFGSGSDPSDGPSSSHPERVTTGASDLEKMEEEEEEEEAGRSPCASTAVQRRLSERESLEADGRERRSTFFDAEERTVTCVTIEPASPGEEEEEEEEVDRPAATTHRIVEIHSPSRSRSNSSSRSRKKAKRKKASGKERKKTRSRSRSRSHSRERSSRSTSWSVEEDYAKKHRVKAKARRSSSDRSSSHDRAKKKRAKEKSKEKRKGPWSRDRRKSRSRSCTPGSSSYEVCESRKKRRRRSGSRARGREGSRSSSTDRARRHKHRRQKSFERYEKKERSSRPRDRRNSRSRSRERRKWRSRSPSASRSREHKRARSREKRPRSRSRSRDKKQPEKDASPGTPQEEPKAPAPGQAAPSPTEPPQDPPAAEETPPTAPGRPEAPGVVTADDLDYGETVEAEHVFDDFSSDAVFIQLDDMSSPPSPESTDSSPERGLLLPLALPVASAQCSVSLGAAASAKSEAPPEPPAPLEGPPGEAPLSQGAPENQVGEGPVVGEEISEAVESEMEVISQIPLLKSKALVKRVTWNLQEEEDSVAGPEPGPRPPLHKLPRSLEGAWKAEDSDPGLNQVQSREPPPTNYMVAEPMFPDLDCAQVYSPNMPLPPTLPPSVPPYAPVSQPTVQFIMQGSLPLVGCGAGQSLTPEPAVLAAASEPSAQAPGTGDGEEKAAAAKPAAERTKNEEYMKKLHVQERAVEEVKLAIKPFYQKREITKDEYKDILRKAVQKICHSKSGEINPMKVANLVKAYVEKYKHMRKHKKPLEAEEEPHDVEN